MDRGTKCRYCQNEFFSELGNQKYCSTDCLKQQKAMAQYRFYGILKDFRRGFFYNYKGFEKLLPEEGTKTMPLADIWTMGFETNC